MNVIVPQYDGGYVTGASESADSMDDNENENDNSNDNHNEYDETNNNENSNITGDNTNNDTTNNSVAPTTTTSGVTDDEDIKMADNDGNDGNDGNEFGDGDDADFGDDDFGENEDWDDDDGEGWGSAEDMDVFDENRMKKEITVKTKTNMADRKSAPTKEKTKECGFEEGMSRCHFLVVVFWVMCFFSFPRENKKQQTKNKKYDEKKRKTYK